MQQLVGVRGVADSGLGPEFLTIPIHVKATIMEAPKKMLTVCTYKLCREEYARHYEDYEDRERPTQPSHHYLCTSGSHV